MRSRVSPCARKAAGNCAPRPPTDAAGYDGRAPAGFSRRRRNNQAPLPPHRASVLANSTAKSAHAAGRKASISSSTRRKTRGCSRRRRHLRMLFVRAEYAGAAAAASEPTPCGPRGRRPCAARCPAAVCHRAKRPAAPAPGTQPERHLRNRPRCGRFAGIAPDQWSIAFQQFLESGGIPFLNEPGQQFDIRSVRAGRHRMRQRAIRASRGVEDMTHFLPMAKVESILFLPPSARTADVFEAIESWLVKERCFLCSGATLELAFMSSSKSSFTSILQSGFRLEGKNPAMNYSIYHAFVMTTAGHHTPEDAAAVTPELVRSSPVRLGPHPRRGRTPAQGPLSPLATSSSSSISSTPHANSHRMAAECRAGRFCFFLRDMAFPSLTFSCSSS